MASCRRAGPRSPPSSASCAGSSTWCRGPKRLPFTHAWDSARGERRVAVWSCGAQDEGGPEIYYRLSLPSATPVRAVVLHRGAVDVDVHLGGFDGSCVARGDTVAEKRLAAGEHAVAVDSYRSAGQSREGAYLLVVLRCEDGDPRCI